MAISAIQLRQYISENKREIISSFALISIALGIAFIVVGMMAHSLNQDLCAQLRDRMAPLKGSVPEKTLGDMENAMGALEKSSRSFFYLGIGFSGGGALIAVIAKATLPEGVESKMYSWKTKAYFISAIFLVALGLNLTIIVGRGAIDTNFQSTVRKALGENKEFFPSDQFDLMIKDIVSARLKAMIPAVGLIAGPLLAIPLFYLGMRQGNIDQAAYFARARVVARAVIPESLDQHPPVHPQAAAAQA